MLLPVNKPQRRRPEIRSSEAVSYGEKKMGLVYAEIELISGDDMALFRRGFLPEEQIKHMKVSVLVDSGAYMLVINEHIKEQLDLPILEEKTARLADETEVKVGVTGPVELRFENRSTTVRALVLPGNAEPLLGIIPMEDMDVVVDPKRQRLIVNPEYPNIPMTYVK
jgi:clan AA aspartic protease